MHGHANLTQSLTDLSGPFVFCQFIFIGQQNWQAPCWKRSLIPSPPGNHRLRHVCHLGKHALATTMNPADKLDSDCEHRLNILVWFWQSLTHLGQISHTFQRGLTQLTLRGLQATYWATGRQLSYTPKHWMCSWLKYTRFPHFTICSASDRKLSEALMFTHTASGGSRTLLLGVAGKVWVRAHVSTLHLGGSGGKAERGPGNKTTCVVG